jgi:hypothetical protein
MKKTNMIQRGLAVFLMAFIAAFSSQAMAEGQYKIQGSKSYKTNIKTQQPIQIGLEVSGVALDSVFFDKSTLQAFVILMNRTPVAVSAEVGIALFDARGKLLATGIDVTGFSFTGDKVRAGDQKNVKLSFDKFLNDYSDVASFQLVFSVVEETKNKTGANVNNSDF